MPKTLTARDRAVELEKDAARYPQERGEILLEAGEAWKQAGDPDRAVAVWNELIEVGGEDAGFARYSVAELRFEQGRDAEAWEHLHALEDGAADAGPAGLVAELLAQRGEDDAALRWFDRAITALSAQEVAAIGEPGGTPSVQASLFFGRQDCRRRLGFPPDDWDRVAEQAERNRLDFVRLLEQTSSAGKRQAPGDTSMLVWQREDQQRAAARWPAAFSPEILGHHPQVERRLREIIEEQGLARVTLILGSVDEFAAYLDETGGDPAEEKVRLAYAERARAYDRYLVWPPGRNERCWCGSERKYKKCCGDPRGAS